MAYLLHKLLEAAGHVFGGSCRSFNKQHLVLPGVVDPLLFGHLPLILFVHFVPDEHFNNVLVRCVRFELDKPRLELLEGLPTGHIVHWKASIDAPNLTYPRYTTEEADGFEAHRTVV